MRTLNFARVAPSAVFAQAIKLSVCMPTLEQFDSETLNALAAYLESLE